MAPEIIPSWVLGAWVQLHGNFVVYSNASVMPSQIAVLLCQASDSHGRTHGFSLCHMHSCMPASWTVQSSAIGLHLWTRNLFSSFWLPSAVVVATFSMSLKMNPVSPACLCSCHQHWHHMPGYQSGGILIAVFQMQTWGFLVEFALYLLPRMTTSCLQRVKLKLDDFHRPMTPKLILLL